MNSDDYFTPSPCHVYLFVNTASKCGLTPQYSKLVELHKTYQGKNFSVIGVPCNQFLGQEPGSGEEIATFCDRKFGVNFPMLEKMDVNGDNRSTLYVHSLLINIGDETSTKEVRRSKNIQYTPYGY